MSVSENSSTNLSTKPASISHYGIRAQRAVSSRRVGKAIGTDWSIRGQSVSSRRPGLHKKASLYQNRER
jgi:hypothetical protein